MTAYRDRLNAGVYAPEPEKPARKKRKKAKRNPEVYLDGKKVAAAIKRKRTR